MTYLRYYNWFPDGGWAMFVYLANEGGLYSIAPLIVRAGHSRYARRVEPKKREVI